jgi:uncharacterized membrane protein (UPF0127 family)
MKLMEILLENLGIPFQNKCNITIINSNREEINVNCEVPATEAERAQGLMYRDKLDKDSGMFFDSVDNGFWMKNVKIPLDMIFINNDKIAEIIPARPFDQTNISPSVPADSNLEVNQGFCEKNNINAGDKIYKS